MHSNNRIVNIKLRKKIIFSAYVFFICVLLLRYFYLQIMQYDKFFKRTKLFEGGGFKPLDITKLINLSPKSAVCANTSICPWCIMSKQPLVNTTFSPVAFHLSDVIFKSNKEYIFDFADGFV